MGVTEVGDLVWARVQGHPQWPGQVMDPKKAPPRAQQNAKKGTVLVSFFGDSSYGWYEHHLLSEFWAQFEENSKQKEKKKQYQQRFAEAIEEAKELWDRRNGQDPTTSHNPPDFLDPNYGKKPAGSDAEGGNDLRPKPAQAEHGKACTAAQVFFWIRAVAQEPFERPKLGPVKVEAAKRQIFSLLLDRNPREQNRRKRKPAGKAATPAEVSDDEAPPKRGRGGKKGSRAAKAAAESSDASGGGTDSDTLPPPKRGRGVKRARQAAKAAAAKSSGESDGDSETPPPPNKRRGGKRAGRPAEVAEQSEESDGEEYSKAQPPPKRGRGGKKGRKAVRAAAADSSEEEGGQPARKRGGKRRAAAPAAPSDSDEVVSDVEEAAGKPTGKRGGKGAVQGAASDSKAAAEAELAPEQCDGRRQKAAQAEPEVEAEALDHAEQAAHEQPEQSKRKRDGRKQAAPKAAAGSAGEAAADAAADAAAEAAAGTKGRRGRPKGSKNKPKPKPPPDEVAQPGKDVKMEGGESDAETPAQNAPKGRPKRLKRKRSGADLKEELFSEDEAAAAEGLMASAAGSFAADEFEAEDAAETKPRRGRKPKVEKAVLALKKLEGRRLKVELKSVSKMLRALAEDPMEADPKQLGSAAVAFLRYREQVFVHELARTGDEPSEPLLRALTAPSTKFQRVFKPRDPNSPRAGRRKAGIEVAQKVTGDAQPSEEQYRVKHYTHQLPATRDAFDQQLLALYTESRAVLTVPKLQETKLDLYEIFKVVAGKGGFEAVSARRQWSKVALEWKPDLPKSTSTSTAMKKHYKQLLLAFEHKVSSGCPQDTVQVARVQKAARKSDVPDTQPGRKRKLVPGQVFVPGMGGDLSFSDALVDPAWSAQQGIPFASNRPMNPTAYAAAAPALGVPQYGSARPDADSGDEYHVSQRGRGRGRGTKRGRAGSSLLERAQPKAMNGAPMGPRASHSTGITQNDATAAFSEPMQVSDKRRVVMQWQLGSRLPSKGLIRHQLGPFGQVSEDNIAIDVEKAVIEVQFGAAGEASGALIALNRKAETMFSVKQGAVDDITLEEAKPDGFGRSADPVATQPQLQAAEAQHWATMQQRMQAEHMQAQMAAQQHQHQHQQPPPLQDPRRSAATLGHAPLDPQMQGQQADGYAWAAEAYGGGPASPPGAALDPRRQPHSAGQGSSAFRPPPGLGPSALPPSSMQLPYGAEAQGSPGMSYMQPAPHQQQQQQPETQAGGGGQVSSTDVQAILQQLQRSQNGSQLPMAPLSQATSGPPVLAGDMAVSDSLTLPTLPPIDPRQQPEIGSSLMNLLQQFGGGQGTNLN